MAVDLMSRIAAALGKTDDARQFSKQASRIRDSFQKAFYDSATGLYRDGEGIEHSSLHANMLPLAFGLLSDPARIAPILTMLKRKGMACSVYGAQYLLEALYNAGASDYALQLLTARTDRSWAHMLYDIGSTITLEAWDPKYKPNLDWNHAWGAAPANIIPRRLMGIMPIEPREGVRRFSIRPQTAGLRHAEILHPTIAGPVQMAISAEPGRSFRMELHTPANTSSSVHLPNLGSPPLVDGKRARNATLDTMGFWQIPEIGSGTHHFESTK